MVAKPPAAGLLRLRLPAPARSTGSHPKMILHSDDGTTVVVPYAPQTSEQDGFARHWARVDRPGRRGLLFDAGSDLVVQTFTLTIGRPDGASIEPLLAELTALANTPALVWVSGLPVAESGPWRITRCPVRRLAREHGTNDATLAEVDLELTEAVVLKAKIGRSTTARPKGKR